jgi:hypothetical protein
VQLKCKIGRKFRLRKGAKQTADGVYFGKSKKGDLGATIAII